MKIHPFVIAGIDFWMKGTTSFRKNEVHFSTAQIQDFINQKVYEAFSCSLI